MSKNDEINRWKSAKQIATTYGHSCPWVYAIAGRFKIRSVLLGGSRLFDFIQLEEVIEKLAEAQKGQPRIDPRAPKPALEAV